jgi:hypothetical protein
MGEALNVRLGTKGLGIKDLGYEAAAHKMSLSDVMAMPELDEYTYSDGKSMVCSNLVAGLWKAAGVFGSLNFNANEFTPYDTYRINIFDPDLVPPEHCLKNDPG